MARLSALVSSLPKFGHAGASIASTRAWNPMLFAAASPRPIQVPSSHQQGSAAPEDLKKERGATETVNVPTNQAQDKAFSTAQPFPSSNQGASNGNRLKAENFSTEQEMSNKTKDAADQVSATAQNISEKAKQTMQEAWESTKNTAQEAGDTVLGKVHQSGDSVKDKAESVKRSMNTKN